MENLKKMATGRNKLETYLHSLFALILNNIVKFSEVNVLMDFMKHNTILIFFYYVRI